MLSRLFPCQCVKVWIILHFLLSLSLSLSLEQQWIQEEGKKIQMRKIECLIYIYIKFVSSYDLDLSFFPVHLACGRISRATTITFFVASWTETTLQAKTPSLHRKVDKIRKEGSQQHFQFACLLACSLLCRRLPMTKKLLFIIH